VCQESDDHDEQHVAEALVPAERLGADEGDNGWPDYKPSG
jgi:hypothetical protein